MPCLSPCPSLLSYRHNEYAEDQIPLPAEGAFGPGSVAAVLGSHVLWAGGLLHGGVPEDRAPPQIWGRLRPRHSLIQTPHQVMHWEILVQSPWHFCITFVNVNELRSIRILWAIALLTFILFREHFETIYVALMLWNWKYQEFIISVTSFCYKSYCVNRTFPWTHVKLGGLYRWVTSSVRQV